MTFEEYLEDDTTRRAEAEAAGVRGKERQKTKGRGADCKIVVSYDPPDNGQVYRFAKERWPLVQELMKLRERQPK